MDAGVLRPAEEGEQLSRLLTVAFGAMPSTQRPFVDRVGPENIRVVRSGGELVATLSFVPRGQFFGGRSVPCTGISALFAGPAPPMGDHF